MCIGDGDQSKGSVAGVCSHGKGLQPIDLQKGELITLRRENEILASSLKEALDRIKVLEEELVQARKQDSLLSSPRITLDQAGVLNDMGGDTGENG